MRIWYATTFHISNMPFNTDAAVQAKMYPGWASWH